MLPATSSRLDELLSFVDGDTWTGIPSITILESDTGEPPVANASSCVFVIKRQASSTTALVRLTNGDGITITDANAWTFSIPKQEVDLDPGVYYWAFQVTDTNAITLTHLQGSLKVLPRGATDA